MVEKFDPWAKAAAWKSIEIAVATSNAGELVLARKEFGKQLALCEIAEKEFFLDVQELRQRPTFQSLNAERCLELKQHIDQGDDSAVMEAVAICLSCGLTPPQWLADNFLKRYQSVVTGEHRGWSDKGAFGSCFKVGVNKAGVFAAHHIAPKAYSCAFDLLVENPSRPIDRELYGEVGEKFDIGHTRAFELIDGYLKDGYKPPLKYIKKFLIEGNDSVQLLIAWDAKKFRDWHLSQGFIETSPNVWEHESAISMPESLKVSGITASTLTSPIEPLQPKGQLNDISSVKPKSSRKTAKTPRS
jgi:hypothetical protein